MAEVAIKIHIGNREYPLRVQEENAATIDEIAKSLNLAIENRKRLLGISDMQDAIAMTAFDSYVKQRALESTEKNVGEELEYELRHLNAQIERAISL